MGICDRANGPHSVAQRYAVRSDQFNCVDRFRGAAGAGKNLRRVQSPYCALNTFIVRASRNNEGRCIIGVGKAPLHGLNALAAWSQTIALAGCQLIRGDQIHADLKLIIVEGFSERRPSGSNHLRCKELATAVNIYSRGLSVASAGMRNENLREDIQSTSVLDNE